MLKRISISRSELVQSIRHTNKIIRGILVATLTISLILSSTGSAFGKETDPTSVTLQEVQEITSAATSVSSPSTEESFPDSLGSNQLVVQGEEASVTFSFNPEGSLYLDGGVTLMEEDLLKGVSAVDEHGRTLKVMVSDLGGLDLQNPESTEETSLSYSITYEAIHPSGAVFLERREVYVSSELGTMPLALPEGTAGESEENPVTSEEELRTAIELATNGDVIYIGRSFALTDNVTIDGINSNLTSLTLIGTESAPEITLADENIYRHFVVSSVSPPFTLTLDNLILTGINNETSGGGGVGLNTNLHTLIMTQCTIQNCFSGFGGGVYTGTANLTNCTLSGNTASSVAGGMYVQNTATLTNCTVAGNTSTVAAGGLNAGTFILVNCTVTGNVAGTGGGVYQAFRQGTIAIYGSIIAGNEGGDLIVLSTTPWDGNTSTPSSPYYNIIGTTDHSLLNIFGADNPVLADNGGPTQTITINPNGPACNRIENTADWPTVPTQDQRGITRPQDSASDIGAVELGSSLLTLQVLPEGSGNIIEGATGIYTEGMYIDLEVEAATGYDFTGWTSEGGGVFDDPTSTRTSFTMPSMPVTVTATFSSSSQQYEVTTDFGTWNGSGTVSAEIEADGDAFIRLMFGDTEVDPSSYTIEGDTVITLSEEYLRTFENGTYSYTAEFSDGFAILTLVVNASSSPEPAGDSSATTSGTTTTTTPKTGDDPGILLLAMLAMTMLVIGLRVLTIRRRYMG